MTINVIAQQSHTIAGHHPRPWRPAGPAPSRREAVIRAFRTPVVRELPPRRDPATMSGDW